MRQSLSSLLAALALAACLFAAVSAIAGTPADLQWDNRFYVSGPQNTVRDLVVFQNRLILAGDFVYIDGTEHKKVAAWDGLSWSAMGAGLSDDVTKLHVFNNELYAIGDFDGVARWNGSSWSYFGTNTIPGMYPDEMGALGDYNGSLVVGSSMGVYRWTDTGWVQIKRTWGGSWSGRVYALTAWNGKLIAAGDVTKADGNTVRGVVQWDGTEWTSVGTGIKGGIRAAAVRDGNLVVMGDIDSAGNVPAENLAIWDGSDWSAYTSGTNGMVLDYLDLGSEFVATGYFSTAGGVQVNHVAKWTGSEWLPYDDGFSPVYNPGTAPVWAVASYEGSVVVGGSIIATEQRRTPRLARWDGAEWQPLSPPHDGKGLDNWVFASEVYDGAVVVGGSFLRCEEQVLKGLARWEDTGWSMVGGGVSGMVRAMTVYDSKLAVAGTLSKAGDAAAKNVALWNGSGWEVICDSMTGHLTVSGVNDMIVYDNKLVMCGYFETVNGVSARHVAAWDGSSWGPLGSGLDSCRESLPSAEALTVYNGDLLVGGFLIAADGNGPDYLLRFDGANWVEFADVNGPVYGLCVYEGDLIVSGTFTQIGGVAANHIARFDGSQWYPMAEGIGEVGGGTTSPSVFLPFDGNLLVGGYANEAYSWGSGVVPVLKMWNGATWQDYSSGISSGTSVMCLTELDGQIFVGGQFMGAGNKAANNFSIWTPGLCCDGTTGNVSLLGIVDLTDLSALVSYLTGGGYTLPCPDEANINAIGIVDLSDLSALVSYLTGGGYVLPNCP